MNELIITPDKLIVVGDSGSPSQIILDLISENSKPAVFNADGSVKTEAVIPAADAVGVQVTADELKTHAWRLPKVREGRLADIRATRNAKLFELDDEANQALTGRPGVRTVEDVEAARQVLRDLPPVAEAALSDLTNTDDIAAYAPAELE